MTDTTAKIREALILGRREYVQWMPEAPTHICGPESGCDAACADYYAAVSGLRTLDEALALLDAERLSVPMSMLMDCGHHYMDKGKLRKVAARYGFDVKETP